ncbi:capsule assembly Wzi family protein [Dyadobacter pollutisoli]|uniref:Capsule assembly Wzi family protein n=1 Tax=Dyadobacter pollutisoli TaxID=2910158 RepID=A0A9E8NCL4_9BACT|nr:capsule assembly Wzi family protein [Dyadobacter pollutisoli]WAC11907.1 capsule assembly Wzi family protein [Dyadobacter pollutisoli]
MRFSNFLILIHFITSSTGFAQSESRQTETYTDSTTNYAEIAGYGSTNGHIPFWMQANQFGTVPLLGPLGSARVGLEHYWALPPTTKRNVWRVGVGAEAVGNFSENNKKVVFPQLHATLRYKNWELYVGRKKQWVGLADSTIGSGSYAWSGNALPIPKIYLGTTRFVSVPFTKNWISFQAFYSDGLFERGRPITSGLKFHQKAFYLRIGKATSRLKLYGGFNHQVQWGGKSKYLTAEDGKLPDGISNYFHAVAGTIGGSGPDITHFDSTSRIGNHLGSIDAAVEVETFGASIFLYRQFVYEDGSLFYFTTLSDGLYGARIRKKNSYGANFEITEGVFEVLFTKNQGGDIFIIGNGKYRGHDNYFNNQQVRDGWSYYDRTVGTPFIPPTSDTKWKWPMYADNFTSNNRVRLYHVGMKGTLFRKIQWQTKLSYSSNSGTYLERFVGSPTQFSGLIAMQTKLDVLGGLTLKGAYAADIGELYRKTHGFMLAIRKDFSFY